MRSFSSSLSRLALLGTVVVASACQHEIHLAGTGAGNHTGSGTGGTGAGTGEDGGGGIPEVILPVDGGSGDAGPVVKMACQDNTTYQPEHSPGYSAADHTMYNNMAAQTLSSMSLTDKADQMRGVYSGSSGPQYSDIERTYDTPGGVRGIQFRDGPRGVNFVQATVAPSTDPNPAQVGNTEYSHNVSTVFPTPVARGATFDVDLEYRLGEAMGDEALSANQTMLLVPCVNILRHPFWGRSQETYGEDDYLLGRMGTGMAVGVQQYIMACAKHFAGNNIEDNRAGLDSEMDTQTLREVYGRHFDMIINDGGVACIMAAYNAVNGTKSTQNGDLLTTMLRNEFGFQGLVLSDWWAMPGGQIYNLDTSSRQSNTGGALVAGLDLEDPWSLNYFVLDSSPTITDQDLNPHALRILEQKFRFNVESTSQIPGGLRTPTSVWNTANGGISNNDAHIAVAQEVAEEAMVLLKNCPASNPGCTGCRTRPAS